MKSRNGLIAGMIVILSAMGFLLDFGLRKVRLYNAEHFVPGPTIFALIMFDLIFAAMLVFAVLQVHKGGFSRGITFLMILVGLLMLIFPIYPIRLSGLSLSSGDFERITGALWIVTGVVDLARRGKEEN